MEQKAAKAAKKEFTCSTAKFKLFSSLWANYTPGMARVKKSGKTSDPTAGLDPKAAPASLTASHELDRPIRKRHCRRHSGETPGMPRTSSAPTPATSPRDPPRSSSALSSCPPRRGSITYPTAARLARPLLRHRRAKLLHDSETPPTNPKPPSDARPVAAVSAVGAS
jgi:hypothetical protein